MREKLGDSYHVEVQKVTKNNGSVKESGQMTALIYNNHMDLWGITSEELYTLAQENMKRLLPVQIKSMAQVMIETIQDKWGYNLGEELLSAIAEDKI